MWKGWDVFKRRRRIRSERMMWAGPTKWPFHFVWSSPFSYQIISTDYRRRPRPNSKFDYQLTFLREFRLRRDIFWLRNVNTELRFGSFLETRSECQGTYLIWGSGAAESWSRNLLGVTADAFEEGNSYQTPRFRICTTALCIAKAV